MHIIQEAVERYGVSRELIEAVILQESGGRNMLASHAGAGGIMQLMPATARALGVKPVYPIIISTNSRGRKIYRLDPRDARANPRANIFAGTRLLARLLKRYNGHTKTALAAYNWGSGNVSKYVKGKKSMPKETAFYYKNITAIQARLADYYQQKHT